MTNKWLFPTMIVGAIGGVIYLATRRRAPAAIVSLNAAMSIAGITPPTPTEGATGAMASITVRNQSTKGGTPWAYSFILAHKLSIGGILIFDKIVAARNFAASEVYTYRETFNIPVGTFGVAQYQATLYDSTGTVVIVPAMTHSFTVAEMAVVPNAVMTFDDTGITMVSFSYVRWIQTTPVWIDYLAETVTIDALGTHVPPFSTIDIGIHNFGVAPTTDFYFDVRAISGGIDVLLLHPFMPGVGPDLDYGWSYEMIIPASLPNGTYNIKIECFLASDGTKVSEVLSACTLTKVSV